MSNLDVAKENLAQMKKIYHYADAEGFESFMWQGQPIPLESAKVLIERMDKALNSTYEPPDEYTN